MTSPLPNSVKMIRIKIAMEDMTLWDMLFCGPIPAGSGSGPPFEPFILLLLVFMMGTAQLVLLCGVVVSTN